VRVCVCVKVKKSEKERRERERERERERVTFVSLSTLSLFAAIFRWRWNRHFILSNRTKLRRNFNAQKIYTIWNFFDFYFKLNPAVNFINILRTNFSYECCFFQLVSSYVLALGEIRNKNLPVKRWWNWHQFDVFDNLRYLSCEFQFKWNLI